MASDLLLIGRLDGTKTSDGGVDATVRTLCVSPTRRSVPLARRFLRRLLREWALAEQSDTAELLLSELVTNAVMHAGVPGGRAGICVTVTRTLRNLSIAVCDESERMPSPPRGALDDEGGRGIFLVEQLAASWGVDATPAGKKVWFHLTLDARGSEDALA